jgi:two-component system nitrogen regulation response regulator GlnG
MQQVFKRIALVAPHDACVLVTGESGTGKELVARAIHRYSSRRDRPFLPVHIAALNPNLVESELFGHARGAFTGAERAHPGLFAEADGGTLFLDEIADAPAEVQAMLLRTLETGEIRPVGGDGARRVDVRVVAASDADLSDAGELRPQLYHRLAGYRVSVPPLRERPDDIGRLLAHFVARDLPARPPLAPGDPPWLPTAAIRAYLRHPWPGNVRELANTARHLAIHGRTGAVALATALAPLGAPLPEAVLTAAPREITDDVLVATLAAQRWKTGAAASALGISKTTLYALIDRSPTIRKARDLERDELAASRDATGGDLDAMSAQLQVSRRGLQLRMRELGM